jgi:hypothetical protein
MKPAPSEPIWDWAKRSEHKFQSKSARLAWLLDARFQIPGTSMRIGLDGLLGLIPGIGDTITTLLALLILGEAIQRRCRPSTLLKMAANIGIDWLIGLLPIAGDVFDILFKANLRNLALLEQDLASRHPPRDVIDPAP